MRECRLRLCSYSLATGGLEADCYLEGVVDPPLETSEGTNHDNSCADTVPEALETDVLVDLGDLLADRSARGLLVQDGNHSVSGVGHNSAEDTSKVT